MGKLRYSVHAYAWTTSWSNETLNLINHAKSLGFDLIEIPLMEIEKVDPAAIKRRAEEVNIGVITSVACSEPRDLTADSEAVRKHGVEYLKQCVKAAADMDAQVVTGVIYSAIGRKIDSMPTQQHWDWAAKGLKEVARYAQDFDVTVGLEPVNRYETFLINTCAQALQLRDMIDEPNVGIHPDAYHMNIEEEDFYSPTKLAAPYICHYHLSESHRGVPGQGTVDWASIYRALADCGYEGVVGLESFIESSEAMRAATCVWRQIAPSSDYLLSEGLKYLKGLEAEIMH
ncbi:MAG TPA: sugar phosphate isomerase/epimerase family protein [Aggregatilineaceae bacterium]|nr:sugar phosphate isomerase/epimerase family protein [Aggregatilineaceae bacterium]